MTQADDAIELERIDQNNANQNNRNQQNQSGGCLDNNGCLKQMPDSAD